MTDLTLQPAELAELSVAQLAALSPQQKIVLARQLEQAGVGPIETAGICTRCQRETFFSHRGDGPVTGRFGAVVMLKA